MAPAVLRNTPFLRDLSRLYLGRLRSDPRFRDIMQEISSKAERPVVEVGAAVACVAEHIHEASVRGEVPRTRQLLEHLPTTRRGNLSSYGQRRLNRYERLKGLSLGQLPLQLARTMGVPEETIRDGEFEEGFMKGVRVMLKSFQSRRVKK